jgi:urease subunit alpha
VKPEWTFKAGQPAWGPIGEGNATVERAEPTRYRPDWGGLGSAAADLSLTFVSAAAPPGLAARLGTRRRMTPIGRVRGLTRADLARNRASAPIEIDPMDGVVTLGGRRLAVDPVREVPLSRRYLLR